MALILRGEREREGKNDSSDLFSSLAALAGALHITRCQEFVLFTIVFLRKASVARSHRLYRCLSSGR